MPGQDHELPSAAPAARDAALLLAASGVLALAWLALGWAGASELLPIAAGNLVAAAVVGILPWRRWPARASLAVVTPALLGIAIASCPEIVPLQARGVFLVLLFAWIGVHHRPGIAMKLAPAVAAAYVGSFSLIDREHPLDARALVLGTLVGVALAELIARRTEASQAARWRAERAARSFAAVGRMTGALAGRDGDDVLAAVVDGVMDIGYDGVNVAVVDHRTSTFEPRFCRGISQGLEGGTLPLTSGLTGLVLARATPQVVPDYRFFGDAIPSIAASGVRTAVGVPIAAGSEVVGVLVASYVSVTTVHPEDIEALRIVALHAGAALATRANLHAERQRAEKHARASVTDELTGVGNRRRAEEVLDTLTAGDSVVLLDVDRFKSVNDEHGHAAGDALLRDLAQYLVQRVRPGDHVLRFGGDELLLVLPSTPAGAAEQVVDRLRTQWARAGLATFSAGVAIHHAGDAAAATLARADAALYEAKVCGRNQVQMASRHVDKSVAVSIAS